MKPAKVISLSLVALGLGSIIYYLLTQARTLTLADKSSRLLSFTSSYCLAGAIAIDLPAIADQFYEDSQIEANAGKIREIKTTYGSLVSQIASMVNLPDSLLYAFMFIESAGNPFAVNGSAVGLMQISVNAATDIVFNEYKHGRLSSAEQEILQRVLGGDRLAQIYGMKSPGTAFIVTSGDLLNPELNILLGGIYLGQLIDESTDANGLRLDKVIVRYNMGYFSFSRGRQLIGDIATVMSKLNPITKNYISKMIGRNGILETVEATQCNA